MPLTQPKTDLAYLRNEKAKAEQKLRSCRNAGKFSGLSGRTDRRSGDGASENLVPSTGSRAGTCKDGA